MSRRILRRIRRGTSLRRLTWQTTPVCGRDSVWISRATNADGVIHYSLGFCQTYAAEAIKVENALRKKGIPVLCLESDFSVNDRAQLLTRVQAFVEMLTPRVHAG